MADASPAQTGTYKFPPLHSEQFPPFDERAGRTSSTSPNGLYADGYPGSGTGERWTPRREPVWGNGTVHTGATVHTGGTRHGRQKSLSEAIRTIRGRHGSMSANAQELAEALKAPVSPKLIGLCAFWYMTSIMSNTSSKTILTAFPKPVTLTLIQFAFVCSWCLFLGWMARVYPWLRTAMPALKNGVRPPTKDIILTTLPLTFFQIGGHILSSDATSRIPVSLVHTIKGLSPLFTVLAYRFVFNIRYSWPTYLSLIPLSFGVAMACSADLSGNFIGIMTALASALLFVTQNIVSKKIFNEAALAEQEGLHRTKKPDKLNLLCYSSGLAFLFTAPIWLFSEGFGLLNDFLHDGSLDLTNKPGSVDHARLILEYIFNGTFHFGQSMVAFILLSMISPVTYSVASLIKRVFVIVFAIIWFGNRMTSIQAVGITLTFLGLYLYDRVSDAAKADRKARAAQLKDRDTILPLNFTPPGGGIAAQFVGGNGSVSGSANGSANGHIGEDKKQDANGPGRPRINTAGVWLPPGTKQEQTWTPQDTRSLKNQVITAM
ncbi:ER to Golgi transport protein-like protein [Rhizodiscina lignyota]|uniref:ER to Golgi transport protein-like protein n=1 Tax=Rhizodiscina lignyota TaxID=1504668 RepID=A0A9P4IDV1_9PEZI|nr:ER to Golgi transport protein-like protein [Rhizodiscina lignyota]